MQTRSPMVIGLPPHRMIAYAESERGPLENLRTLARPVSKVKQTQRWLGAWALEHPTTTHPWRRERARMQLATVTRELAQRRRGGA